MVKTAQDNLYLRTKLRIIKSLQINEPNKDGEEQADVTDSRELKSFFCLCLVQ